MCVCSEHSQIENCVFANEDDQGVNRRKKEKSLALTNAIEVFSSKFVFYAKLNSSEFLQLNKTVPGTRGVCNK